MSEKRFNIKDDFENLYLRSKTLKRFLHKADPSILKDPEFKKVINYIAGRFYNINRGVYRMAGFDFEDIHSMAQIYGLAFMGTDFEAKNTREMYLIMLNFINQRLSQASTWIAKKFQIDEMYPNQLTKVRTEIFDNLRTEETNPIIIDGVCVSASSTALDNEIECNSLLERIDVLSERLDSCDKKEKRAIKKEIKQAKEERQKKTEVKKKKRNLKEMKEELRDNWEKYTDDLAFYSVSNFVSSDVRKKARSLCKKHGINYMEWAKQQVEARVYTNDDFCGE